MFATKSRDAPTQIAGHPGHSLSITTKKDAVHKVAVRASQGQGQGYPGVWVLDVPRASCPEPVSSGCFSCPEIPLADKLLHDKMPPIFAMLYVTSDYINEIAHELFVNVMVPMFFIVVVFGCKPPKWLKQALPQQQHHWRQCSRDTLHK